MIRPAGRHRAPARVPAPCDAGLLVALLVVLMAAVSVCALVVYGPLGALMTLTLTWRFPMPDPEQQRYTPLTGEDRDRLAAELRRRYERGATLRALAAEVGRSYGLVRKLVLAQGATLRGRGGAGTRKARS